MTEGKIKKILVLVQCPKCRGAFYINEKELKEIPKQTCRVCFKEVILKEV